MRGPNKTYKHQHAMVDVRRGAQLRVLVEEPDGLQEDERHDDVHLVFRIVRRSRLQ